MPEYGIVQADAGRDCRTRLARPNSQARTGTVYFSCSADHEKNWQPYPVDPYSCYLCDHTYMMWRGYRLQREFVPQRTRVTVWGKSEREQEDYHLSRTTVQKSFRLGKLCCFPPILSTYPLYTDISIAGVGKEKRILIGPR